MHGTGRVKGHIKRPVVWNGLTENKPNFKLYLLPFKKIQNMRSYDKFTVQWKVKWNTYIKTAKTFQIFSSI